MIFTGLKDENGNIIPVQGAGTVYNEDKNSIAIGRDTSAIGQDQFVFGRKNVEDSNKAEIVGGGVVLNEDYRSSTYTNVAGITVVTFKIGESKQDLEEYLSKVLGYNFVVSDWNNDIKSIYRNVHNSKIDIIFNTTSKNMTVGDTIYSDSYSIAGTKSVSHYTTLDTWAVASLNPSVPGIYYEEYKLYYAPAYLDGSDVTNIRKNIRTLGWDGTQWNAGDITCDDGNGNTISMRDLLSRIAVLENAQS